MRILIQTMGTRGDVQPYVALARGLGAAGHEALLTAPEQFRAFVAEHGVAFAPLPAAFLELMETPEAREAMRGRRVVRSGLRLMRRVKPIMRQLFDAQWQAAAAFRPDILVYHPKALVGPDIAEKLGIAAILASPLPGFTPTEAFPSPLLPFANLGPLNLLSHSFVTRGSDASFAGTVRAFRQEVLDLPAARPLRVLPVLYAYSPSVLPAPPDWGPEVLVSGYWFLDDRSGWTPPSELQAFLQQGPPPVYVGFGSMPGEDAAATSRLVCEALADAGQRGVLATGWGGLSAAELPPHVFAIESAPHEKLFPLMAAVVHHGGAGTTAAALRAGRPAVICPFFGDQPFWGRRIAALGTGPAPLPKQALTSSSLAAAISAAVGDAEMRQRAEALGTAIRAEDGIAAAIGFIARHGGGVS